MKIARHAILALALSAAVLLLTGCTGASNVAAPSNPGVDNSPPQPPTNLLVVSDPTTGRDRLDWNASPSANVQSYQIYRYVSAPGPNSTGEWVGGVNASTTAWYLPLVNSDCTEYYAIRSVSSANVPSAFSADVVATRTAWTGTHGTGGGGHGSGGVE